MEASLKIEIKEKQALLEGMDKDLKAEMYLRINGSFPTRQMQGIQLQAGEKWHVKAQNHERNYLYGALTGG